MKSWARASVALAMLALASAGWAWGTGEIEEYDAKSKVAIAEFKDSDSSVQRFFDESVGYVVIPTVGKAGFGIGGVAIFTQAKGGLMYEASVGGQKFKVEEK